MQTTETAKCSYMCNKRVLQPAGFFHARLAAPSSLQGVETILGLCMKILTEAEGGEAGSGKVGAPQNAVIALIAVWL